MNSITVPAEEDRLYEVTEFVDEQLAAYDCSPKMLMQIEIAIEEIFINIASYAYNPIVGETEVSCEVLQDPLRVVIQFLDGGKPFDPLAKEDPDRSEEAIDEREGGLGIYMVKESMDDVSYTFEDGKNILTIQKKL